MDHLFRSFWPVMFMSQFWLHCPLLRALITTMGRSASTTGSTMSGRGYPMVRIHLLFALQGFASQNCDGTTCTLPMEIEKCYYYDFRLLWKDITGAGREFRLFDKIYTQFQTLFAGDNSETTSSTTATYGVSPGIWSFWRFGSDAETDPQYIDTAPAQRVGCGIRIVHMTWLLFVQRASYFVRTESASST